MEWLYHVNLFKNPNQKKKTEYNNIKKDKEKTFTQLI